jgi:hypothetical protein
LALLVKVDLGLASVLVLPEVSLDGLRLDDDVLAEKLLPGLHETSDGGVTS